MATELQDPTPRRRLEGVVAAHRGDLLLVERHVAFGHRLDVLLRREGVHVHPVCDLHTAVGAAGVFRFDAVPRGHGDHSRGDCRRDPPLRSAPGLRGATIFASANDSARASVAGAGDLEVLLPRPLDPAAVSRQVLDAMPRREADIRAAPGPSGSAPEAEMLLPSPDR